uniref:Glycosyltransferase n=1 Tax=Epimedium koreanum TaxID=63351 RepID=A0A8B0H7F9_9MAGN|nr:flavonoid 3-O-glucosyltransferase [Epimedium koreanum]
MSGENVHVAVLAFPFGTHAAPLLTLTQRLSTSAPNATFSFLSTTQSNTSIFTTQNLPNIKAYNIDDEPGNHVYTGSHEDYDLFMRSIPTIYNNGIQKSVLETGKSITCFLTDLFLFHAADLAEELKVPWIPFWTAGACSLSTHLHTDLIIKTITNHPGREDMKLNFIPGMPTALQIKDLPMEVFGGDMGSMFVQLLLQMGKTLLRATAVALNTFEELEQSVVDDFKLKFQHCLAIGPFTLTNPKTLDLDRHDCLSWLSNQKPESVVYISFGTLMVPPPDEITALADALEKSGVPFLWSLKDNFKGQLPEGFMDRVSRRGMVVPWAPQAKVLEHPNVAVFVTHCGWNSVLESITGGVPMICRPFFGDQKPNGRLVSDVWGIGVGAKDGVLSKDGLIDAFDLVVSKEQGKKLREKVQTLKEVATQAVGDKGSSTTNFNKLLGLVTSTN